MRTTLVALSAIALFAALLFTPTAVSAKKPAPPPDPDPAPTLTGTIVYARSDLFSEMDPDGSNTSTLEFDEDFTDVSDVRAAVSRGRHNGKLWLLQSHPVGSTVHPDGEAHRELFAIGEGDDDAIQLTSDTSMEFSWYQASVSWGPGDSFVSWVAHTWKTDPDSGESYVDEAGIFAAPLRFDEDGDILGLDDDPVLVAEVGTYEIPWSGVVVTDVCYGHEWSPDGEQVLWHHVGEVNGGGTLRITDVSDPTTSTLLTSTVAGRCGVWSDEGGIAWLASGVIRRILPNGTGEEVLYTAGKRESLSFLIWSSDGEYLAYASDGNKVAIYTLAVDDATRSSTGVQGRPKRWLAE